MKIKKFLSTVLSVICVVALCVPAKAIESRASAQIAAYAMQVNPHSGYFSVFFSVTAAGEADKLGCESIYVYKMVDFDWELVKKETKRENDPGMSIKNDYDYANSIHCNSEAGEAYKIEVTIFAENSKGRDTRSKVFYNIGE